MYILCAAHTVHDDDDDDDNNNDDDVLSCPRYCWSDPKESARNEFDYTLSCARQFREFCYDVLLGFEAAISDAKKCFPLM